MGRVRKTLVIGLFLPLCAPGLARGAEGEKVNLRKITSFYPGVVSLDARYLSFTDWSTGDLAVWTSTQRRTRCLYGGVSPDRGLLGNGQTSGQEEI